MAVMDEFREERERIKTAPARVKWQYFKDYYLMWVLAAGAAIAVVIWFLASILTQKEPVLYVAMVNFAPAQTAETEVEQAFTQRFLEDPRHEEIVIDTSIRMQALTDAEEVSGEEAASPGGTEEESPLITGIKYSYEDEQKLMVLVMTGTMDLLVTGQDLFERYIPAGWYRDLREVLDAGTLAAYDEAGRVLYADGIPVGIRMEESKVLRDQYFYTENDGAAAYAGFVQGGPHPETAAAFLGFME